MFAVIFEVRPGAGKKDDYLGFAKGLKPALESIDGFIDNERYESKRRAGWVLSLSTWRDEKAVVRWRARGDHHGIQRRGRSDVFDDYRLRVCEVTSDSMPPEGLRVAEQRFDETEIGEAKAVAITELSPAPHATLPEAELVPSHLGLDDRAHGLVDRELYESIYNPGKLVLLTAWRTQDDAAGWIPTSFAGIAELRHRRVRNVREYGMFDRREAAQYFPDARTGGSPR